ncbi:phosphosulfolactate synthase [Brevibacillus choshinensis]|uniref:phosphosulfolactate synthase n=1 Tax=Brevibacillus choshinensis TaxID=54911 RepID=UPI002E1C93FD|nr:phosphosulfolactate synthase [Brevibacillus choshinensis]
MLDSDHPLLLANWANPSGHKREKPRDKGLTMVIDKGVGLTAYRDLLEMAAPYFDIYKLGFGTSALYTPSILKQKLSLAVQYGLHIMPGGTFFEVALRQSSVLDYLNHIVSSGFNAVEISDGTFPLSPTQRRDAIIAGVEAGLVVYTEVGKKASDYRAEREELLETLHADLDAGASHVIVEARESGTVGIFDKDGCADDQFVLDIARTAGDKASKLIWEAPRKEQQVSLICALGNDVNLGNVCYQDVLSVETLRRGLRGDTAAIIEAGRSAPCE